ncbi:MAG: hypothetical protein NTZ46_11390 [Verrucomicrobia bacterium]|nr:hypothetical protein [Verrucomicrobiota bacterium]
MRDIPLSVVKAAKAAASEIEKIKSAQADAEREIRQIEAKAQAIEDAAFDLEAVKPHAKAEEDTRTPAELIEFIGKKGLEV